MSRLFFATLIAVALLTKTDPGSANELSRFGTVESLVDRGTFQLDDSSFIGTVDKIYRDGHFYSHQTPLLPVLEAPVYWAINLPGIRFNNRGRFVMTYLFILFTNGVALALTVVMFARILEVSGVGPNVRDWLALLMVGGTWLLPYGLVSNGHGISGLLLAALIYLLLLVQWRGITDRRVVVIGGVLGLLSAIELLPLISFAPLTFAFLASRRMGGRSWLYCCSAFAAPLIAQSALNLSITGDLIPAGFHHELFNYPGSVFDAQSLTGTVKYQSVGDVGEYAWTSLFAGKGFFSFAPLLLLGLAAGFIARRWWWSRARGVHLVVFGGSLISLTLSILTTNNYGGEAVGFRHAAYLAPAFVTLLLPWIAEGSAANPGRRRAVMITAAISTALMLVFAVRQPWSVLSISSAPIGTWDQYVPIIAKVVGGTLFSPD